MTYSSDRLDRIEAILSENARQLTENARQLVETRQLVESNAAGLRETRAITESNARAIEAWGSRIEEVQVDTEEATSSTRADLAVRIEDNAHNQGIDRVRFDALHEEHTRRFNTLLEEARADRLTADQRHQEWTTQFNNMLEEGRADRAEIRAAREQSDRDRALNESEHRAFRETFQTMLAEIARLWQRVAG